MCIHADAAGRGPSQAGKGGAVHRICGDRIVECDRVVENSVRVVRAAISVVDADVFCCGKRAVLIEVDPQLKVGDARCARCRHADRIVCCAQGFARGHGQR